MKNHRLGLIVGAAFCFACLSARLPADSPVSAPAKPTPPANTVLDAQQLGARIDQLIAARWAANNVKPAPLADDAEYLRRLYLDLAGRIPRTIEVRDFLDDTAADKRRRAVERLLEDPDYAHQYINHFTNVWRALLVTQTNNQQVQFLLPSFEAWLRQHVRANTPYDEMVRKLLTARITFTARNPNQLTNQREPTPLAFYQANDHKAENLAAATTRLFLGVKLECAQCHDHPHDHWTRKQFWEYAAFFSGIRADMNGDFITAVRENAETRSLKIPGTERVVLARFLDGKEPAWQADTGTRPTLAQWITDPQNPVLPSTMCRFSWEFEGKQYIRLVR